MQQISVRQLQEMLSLGQSVYLVDVRQPWEHEVAHLPNDVLAPLDQLLEQAEDLEPPAEALVVTYCHHGVRSLNAAAILLRQGHTRVASLAGGIDRWSLEIDPTVPRY
jgi:adenylyltransferase/sulfurtransferase